MALTKDSKGELLPIEQRGLGDVYQLLAHQSIQDINRTLAQLPPDHPAKGHHGLFRKAKENLWGSIAIGLGNRLAIFQNKLVDAITRNHDVDLRLPGQKPCAYFVIISAQDSAYRFLSSLFFSLALPRLSDYARLEGKGGCLPVLVNFCLDEYCNLIWEKRCGRGDANQIYLATVEPQDDPDYSSAPFVPPEEEPRTSNPEALDGPGFSTPCQEPQDMGGKNREGCASRITDIEAPELRKPRPSYKDLSHTYPSQPDVSLSVPRGGGRADGEAELMGILVACELQCFSRETARVFENAIERLYYADSFRVGNATLPQSRVRTKLKLLDYTILQTAEAKLHANLDRPVKNSTAYAMATIFNCIAESESDTMVDPYLNGLRTLPPGR